MKRFLFLISILFYTSAHSAEFAAILKNLNTTQPSELIDKGVPEDVVKTVIGYRVQLNGFNTINDLKRIPGVTPAIFEILQNNFFVPSSNEYRIYAGDAIDLRIGEKGVTEIVAPDGYIYITNYGRFLVGGITVLDVQELLSNKIEDISVKLGAVSSKVAVIVTPGVGGSGRLVAPGPLSQVFTQINTGYKARYKARVMRVNPSRQAGGGFETFDLSKLNHIDPFIQNGDVVFIDKRNVWRVADTVTEYFAIILSPFRAIGDWLGIAAKTGA